MTVWVWWEEAMFQFIWTQQCDDVRVCGSLTWDCCWWRRCTVCGVWLCACVKFLQKKKKTAFYHRRPAFSTRRRDSHVLSAVSSCCIQQHRDIMHQLMTISRLVSRNAIHSCRNISASTHHLSANTQNCGNQWLKILVIGTRTTKCTWWQNRADICKWSCVHFGAHWALYSSGQGSPVNIRRLRMQISHIRQWRQCLIWNHVAPIPFFSWGLCG